MGHRALLAYRRDDADRDSTAATGDDADTERPSDARGDATYDLHRSHWGAADFALADRLSAADPFAADTAFAVDPEPVATDLALADAAANHLDFLHHEAFYRVALDYETTAFHVLWFGLEADGESVERSETVGHGALVEVRNDPDFLRGWFRGTKAVVAESVDRGARSPKEAIDDLGARVETWAEDREVMIPATTER